jgi:N-acyl-D-amino-acid deacylase
MRTLFKGGTIYDGSSRKPFVGDVLIEDDRIIKVVKSTRAKADKVIDVSGKIVCPGLIDAHSHNDFFYDREDAEKFYKPFIEQGITTQITGTLSPNISR